MVKKEKLVNAWKCEHLKRCEANYQCHELGRKDEKNTSAIESNATALLLR